MEQAPERNVHSSKLPVPRFGIGQHKSRISRSSTLHFGGPLVVEKADTETQEKASTSMRPTQNLVANSNIENSEWIGKKVCIGGVKPGVVRYYGYTEFAEGLWCGIELDEPVGKHNGSINGVNYFNCKENHGIFAPPHKLIEIPPSPSPHEQKQNFENKINHNVKSRLPSPKMPYATFSRNFKDSAYNSESVSSNTTFSKLSGSKCKLNDTFIHSTDTKSNSVFSKNGAFSLLSQTTKDKKLSYNNSSHLCSNTHYYANKNPAKRKLSLASNVSSSSENKNIKELLNRTVSLPNCGFHDVTFRKDDKVESNDAFNTTFSLVNVKGDSEILNNTFHISSPSIAKSMESKDLLSDSELNRTFTVEEVQNSLLMSLGDGTGQSNFLQNYRESEEDLASIDLEDSLGILTPSQMKDFTVCAEFHAAPFEKTEFSKIPKIESCDDINEIPEYEIARDINTFSPVDDVTDAGISAKCFKARCSESPICIDKKNFFSDNIEALNDSDIFIDLGKTSTPTFHTSTPFSNNFTSVIAGNLNAQSKPNLNQDSSVEKCLNLPMPSDHFLPHDDIKCKLLELVTKDGEKGSDEVNLAQKKDLSVCNESFVFDENLPDFSLTDVTISQKSAIQHSLSETHKSEANNISLKTKEYLSRDDETDCTENEKHSDDSISGDTVCNPDSYESSLGKRLSEEKINELSDEINDISLSQKNLSLIENTDKDHLIIDGSDDANTTYLKETEFDNNSEHLNIPLCSPCEENMKDSLVDSCIGMETSQSEKKSDTMVDSDVFTDSGAVGLTESVSEIDGDYKEINKTFEKLLPNNYESDLNETLTLGNCEQNINDLSEGKNRTLTLTAENSLPNREDPEIESIVPMRPSEIIETNASSKFLDAHAVHQSNKVLEIQHENILDESSVSNATNTPDSEKLDDSNMESNVQAASHKSLNESTKKGVKPSNLYITKNINKNVVSKVKTMLENSSCSAKSDESVVRKQVVKKVSRWDSVSSKLAASMAEEKYKSKREIRSRIDTNLTYARQAKKSPRVLSSKENAFALPSPTVSSVPNKSAKAFLFANNKHLESVKENVNSTDTATTSQVGQAREIKTNSRPSSARTSASTAKSTTLKAVNLKPSSQKTSFIPKFNRRVP